MVELPPPQPFSMIANVVNAKGHNNFLFIRYPTYF